MIVVTAPTGQIGRQVLAGLFGSGETVRVIARDPSRLDPYVREGAEIVEGSHADPDVVGKAFAGAGSLFWLVPPDPRAASVEGHVLDFTRPACAAIREHGVARVVGVSTVGRRGTRNAGPVSAALAMDELLEGTGVHYRALRMPGFMENLLWQVGPIRDQGVFFEAVAAGHRLPTCATRDVAAVAVGLLRDRSWTGQESVAVLGPEDLSPEDRARIMSEVLRRPVRFQHVPVEAYRTRLVRQGTSEAWAQGLADMAARVGEGLYDVEPGTPRSNTPTTFRQWCEEVLRPAVLC